MMGLMVSSVIVSLLPVTTKNGVRTHFGGVNGESPCCWLIIGLPFFFLLVKDTLTELRRVIRTAMKG